MIINTISIHCVHVYVLYLYLVVYSLRWPAVYCMSFSARTHGIAPATAAHIAAARYVLNTISDRERVEEPHVGTALRSHRVSDRIGDLAL